MTVNHLSDEAAGRDARDEHLEAELRLGLPLSL